MAHVLVRHRVADVAAWRQVFDAKYPEHREAFGFGPARVFQADDNPYEVFVLIPVDDLDAARDAIGSDRLKIDMEKAGVVGRPEVFFLRDELR